MSRNNAALPTPPNTVYRLKVIGKIEEQVTVTTFYYSDNTAVTSPPAGSFPILVEAFSGFGGHLDPFLACLSADWSASRIEVDAPTFPTSAPYIVAETGVGEGPGGHLPTQMAASLIKKTAFKGQCGRGRWALPAVPTAWCTLSTVTTPAAYTAFANRMTQVISVTPVDLRPVLFSRKGSVTHPTMGSADLKSVTFNTILGTSRRRKLGVGI